SDCPPQRWAARWCASTGDRTEPRFPGPRCPVAPSLQAGRCGTGEQACRRLLPAAIRASSQGARPAAKPLPDAVVEPFLDALARVALVDQHEGVVEPAGR